MRVERLILDLLFPRRCPLCGKISNGICRDCARRLPYVRQPSCFCCGRQLQSGDREFCAVCSAHPAVFTQGRALYSYSGQVRHALHAVKYQNKREYLEYFSADMAERLGGWIRTRDPQVLIPIPMQRREKRKRGFNQAELLAKQLGRSLELPVCPALVKVRKTAEQKTLDYRGRRQNLKGAFAVDPKIRAGGALPWKRVMLVDDVCTTGSTLNEAARVLRGAGAEEVYFVTLCIVPDRN